MAMQIAVVLIAIALALPAQAQPLNDQDIQQASRDAVFGQPLKSDAGMIRLQAGADPSVLPAINLALRFRGPNPTSLATASALAGKPIKSWADLQLWLEAHPKLQAHSSYRSLKLRVLDRIDPNFRRFLDGPKSLQENMGIRLSEIVWGGVKVDGIPSLDDPDMIRADHADYMQGDDLVFGVAINGDVRAYPVNSEGTVYSAVPQSSLKPRSKIARCRWSLDRRDFSIDSTN